MKSKRTEESKVKGYLLHHFRLAWRYYSEKRKECLAKGVCELCGVSVRKDGKRIRQRASGNKRNSGPVAVGTARALRTGTDPGDTSPKLVADHIEPVVDPRTGFIGWDNYYDRMFNGQLQCLCEVCHKAKSKEENAELRKVKKERLANAQN